MTTRKNKKSNKSNKRIRKTRSKRQRGGTINNNIKLIRSSMFGNREAVRRQLEQDGIDVNAKNSEGYTALILASSNGHKEIVEMLLEKGADVNAKDKYNATALIKASSNGHTEIVAKLLDAGADVNAKNDYGYTALIQASRNKHTEIVAMLLDNRADVNATDDDGDTALMKVINCNEEDDRPWYQVEYDIIEIVEMLLTAGADVNVVNNNNNKKALAIANETKCTKKILSLLKRQERQMVPEITAMMRRTTGQNVDPNISRYIGENFIGGKRKTHKNHKKK